MLKGHRPSHKLAYDHDAFEIMSSFSIGFLSPWLTEVHNPLGAFRTTRPQREDLPDRIVTMEAPQDLKQVQELFLWNATPVFHSDTGKWIDDGPCREGTK